MSDNLGTKLLAGIGAAAVLAPIIFGISILIIMWRTWWLYPAWAWYVEPLGAPHITFWHFAGINLLIATVIGSRFETKKDDRKEDYGKWIGAFGTVPFIWLLLWWMHR